MIKPEDLKLLWEHFGTLHGSIQQRRQLAQNMLRDSASNVAEEHLCKGLIAKLDEMNKTLNEANLFIKDYEPQNTVIS